MTPEGKVKEKVKKMLKKYGAYWLCPVMNGMGAPALDFHCIYKGRGFCIETKAPGKKPTPRQVMTMSAITAVGGKCFVISGEEGYIDLDNWLARVALVETALDHHE